MASIFTTKKAWYVEFLAIFLTCVLVRGGSVFSLTLNGDDLLFSHSDASALIHAHLSQLRVFPAIEVYAAKFFGGIIPFQGAFWNLAQLGSMTAFALALRSFWARQSPSLYAVTIGLLFVLLPYQTDIQTFKIANPVMTFSYLAGAYGIGFGNHKGLGRIFRLIAVAVSLGYQTLFSLYVIAGLVKSVLLFVDGQKGRLGSTRNVLMPLVTFYLGLAAASLISVGLGYLAAKLFSGSVSDRATLMTPDLIDDKIQLVVRHTKKYILGKDFGSSLATGRAIKLAQSAIVVLSALSILLTPRQPRFQLNQRIITTLYVLLAYFASAAFILLPALVLQHTSEGNRFLLAASVYPAGVSILLFESELQYLRRAAAALAAYLCLSYAVLSSSIDALSARNSHREILNASRMVDRLNQGSTKGVIRSVVFIGDPKFRDLESPGDEHLKPFVHSLFWPWARIPLLSEISGQRFAPPSPEDIKLAKRLSAAMPEWPAKGSVRVNGDLGIIVLSH
ncbi:MAG: hypothetical protein ACKN89_07910 [Cyanobium sp.]|jgi:hypothetical protein